MMHARQNFETHSKHSSIMEIIELNAECERESYIQAVKNLENHSPHNGFISEFKEKVAV